jgi:hypothetical protein
MATTRLADLIYGPLFVPTVIQRTAEGSVLRQSGIVGDDPRIAQFANAPGDLVQMPYWNDLTGRSNVSTDDPAQTATPNKLTQGQDMARKIRRNYGVQAANLVNAFSAQDPLDVAAQLVGSYWVREEQRLLIEVLNGVFATAGMAGNVLPLASEDGNGPDAVMLDADASTDAHALLGEQGIDLSAVVMHSRLFWNLDAANAIEYRENPAGLTNPALRQRLAYWHGKRVIVSDQAPRVPGATSGYKYTSYFFQQGAVGYSEATGAGGPEVPVELESAPAAGNGEGVRTVWYRRHWVMHIRGVAFTGTPASASGVTDEELASGANYTRVYDPKNIRVVAVTTNG